MKKGFAIDSERLKGNSGGNYWEELLNTIRDIRSSEQVLIIIQKVMSLLNRLILTA